MTDSNPILEDTTLREGEQAPGIVFNREMKIKIHDLLVDAGVRWIEVGIPAAGGEELQSIRELVNRGSEAVLVAWNRGRPDDLDLSMSLGFKAVHIGLPVSPLHLKYSVNKSAAWALATAQDLVKRAKDSGVFVSVGAEDVGRAEVSFLEEYAGAVAEAGADRLRLSDTIGILDFYKYAEIVRRIRMAVRIDLHCHTHNDFGLGAANTIAGLNEGARYFHATLNGIGERAGMPDAIQVIMLLRKLYGIDLGIDPEKIARAGAYLSEITNTNHYPWAPVVGKNVFTHESGIHVKGMLRDCKTFEPFGPEELGRKRRYVLGKHSGREAIRHFLSEGNIEPTDRELSSCLELVKQRATDKLGEVSEEELLEIYSGVRQPGVKSTVNCNGQITSGGQ